MPDTFAEVIADMRLERAPGPCHQSSIEYVERLKKSHEALLEHLRVVRRVMRYGDENSKMMETTNEIIRAAEDLK